MIHKEIKIPTEGRPIEAYVMYKEPKPEKAFLILPGRDYTINHFLLDFLWRMAAENGYYAIKAEYRGYTYRHLDEPHDHEHATKDAYRVVKFLQEQGYPPESIIICGKSLGSIAVANLVVEAGLIFDRAVLLTPVLYVKRPEVFPGWSVFASKIKKVHLVFGSNDPFCDLETARETFPKALIDYYEGADHGLHLSENYVGTIELKKEIINKIKDFSTQIR